jgi:hypothetical protein
VPYLTCSSCGLSLHSASAYLPYSDCPRCARRGRTVPLDLSPFRLKRSALAAQRGETPKMLPQVMGRETAHADGAGELGAA